MVLFLKNRYCAGHFEVNLQFRLTITHFEKNIYIKILFPVYCMSQSSNAYIVHFKHITATENIIRSFISTKLIITYIHCCRQRRSWSSCCLKINILYDIYNYSSPALVHAKVFWYTLSISYN